MKTAFLLSLTFLFYISSSAQSNPDTLIKKLRVREEMVVQGDRQAGYIEFDTYGHITHHMYNDFIGGPISTSSFSTYNNNNKLIESKSTHSSFPNDTTIRRYHYNQSGNLIAITDNNNRPVFNYTYDEAGKKIKELLTNSSGTLTSERTYTYDTNGNEKEEHLVYKNIIYRFNKTYYDSLNRKIRTESIQNNALRFSDTYFYDEYTKLLAEELYDEDGSGRRLDGVMYKYDNNQRLVKRSHFNLMPNKNKEIVGEETFEYFDNGLIKSYTEDIDSVNHQKRTFVYSYKFFN